MDDDQQVILDQLSAQVSQSSLRFVRLENDASEAEVLFTQAARQQEIFNEYLATEIAVLEKAVVEAQSLVKMLTRDVGRVSLSLRELVKHDVLREVEHKADRWPLEFFVTRDEFARMLRRSLNP